MSELRGLDSWIEGDNVCTYCGQRRCVCPPECPECGHAPHRGECTVERGDSYQAGFAPMALGPCGCTYEEDDEVERVRESDYDWLSQPRYMSQNGMDDYDREDA